MLVRSIFALAFYLILSACNNRSLPWSTSVPIHNSVARDFLVAHPSVTPALGRNLAQPEFFDDGMLVGMAISGGGMRANAFTLGIFAEIEHRAGQEVFDRIDFISSNSGGSWAAAAMLYAKSKGEFPTLAKAKPDIARRFQSFNKGKVKCYETKLKQNVLENLTFGDVYPAGSKPKLPFVYFNASMIPSQNGFVFTEDHANAYDIRSFHAGCEDSEGQGHVYTGDISSLPIGFAAATSGSVPSFAHSYAITGICESRAIGASFCRRDGNGWSRRSRNYVQLVDGGLYDNLGYKAALELASSLTDRKAEHRGLIFVNASTDLRYRSIRRGKRYSSHGINILSQGSFATQDATYAQLKEVMFASAGIAPENQVTLDFNAAAEIKRFELEELLEDLPTLAHYAAHSVNCYKNDGELLGDIRKPRMPKMGLPTVEKSLSDLVRKGEDCVANNFSRVGYLYKTTYAYDPYFFDSAYELGQLVVRKNWSAIERALGPAI